MKVRSPVILLPALALLCGAGYAAFSVHRYVTVTVPNAYAAEWVGAMVVDYLRRNGDRWPRSWEDLRPVYERHVSEAGRPWAFGELKSRVRVRWDVDVGEVRRLKAPPRDLITLSDGGREHWGGQEPNEAVHRYLARPGPADRHEEPDSPAGGDPAPPVTRPAPDAAKSAGKARRPPRN